MSQAEAPQDYHSVTPYRIVQDVPRLIAFLIEAFGGRERMRMPRADGSVAHAEVVLGDSIIMMGEPIGEYGPMPAGIFLRVADADAAYRNALRAGATSVMEPTDMLDAGHRYGGVKDPCGNIWWPAARLKTA